MVQRKLPILHEQQHARRRELLRNRTDLKHGVFGHRHVPLQVRDAVAFYFDRVTFFDNRKRKPGNLMLLHIRLDQVVGLVRENRQRRARHAKQSDRRADQTFRTIHAPVLDRTRFQCELKRAAGPTKAVDLFSTARGFRWLPWSDTVIKNAGHFRHGVAQVRIDGADRFKGDVSRYVVWR
jgi:hypothetical protein